MDKTKEVKHLRMDKTKEVKHIIKMDKTKDV